MAVQVPGQLGIAGKGLGAVGFGAGEWALLFVDAEDVEFEVRGADKSTIAALDVALVLLVLHVDVTVVQPQSLSRGVSLVAASFLADKNLCSVGGGHCARRAPGVRSGGRRGRGDGHKVKG